MFCLMLLAIVTCRDLQVSYDVEKLQNEITTVEDKYFPRHPGSENWTAIPLRNAAGSFDREGVEIYNSIRKQKMLPCKDTEIMGELPFIASVLQDIAERFDAEVGIVRLSKVPSQRQILPHEDGKKFDLERGTIYRLHIPIVTGNDVIFMVDHNDYNLEAGKLYYTNVSKTHSVKNNGPIDRVHLVVDVHANTTLHDYILQSPEVAPAYFLP